MPDELSAGSSASSLHTPNELSATPVHSPSSTAILAGSGPPFQYWFGQPTKSPATTSVA